MNEHNKTTDIAIENRDKAMDYVMAAVEKIDWSTAFYDPNTEDSFADVSITSSKIENKPGGSIDFEIEKEDWKASINFFAQRNNVSYTTAHTGRIYAEVSDWHLDSRDKRPKLFRKDGTIDTEGLIDLILRSRKLHLYRRECRRNKEANEKMVSLLSEQFPDKYKSSYRSDISATDEEVRPVRVKFDHRLTMEQARAVLSAIKAAHIDYNHE